MMKKLSAFCICLSIGLAATGCGRHDSHEHAAVDLQRAADHAAVEAAHGRADHGGPVIVEANPRAIMPATIAVQPYHPVVVPLHNEEADIKRLGAEAREDAADAAGLAAKEAAEQLLRTR